MRNAYRIAAALFVPALVSTALAMPGAALAKAPKGKTVTVKGGTITLTLAPGVASAFASDTNKIVLAPVSPATAVRSTVTMPITRGKLNNATGAGSVLAGGGAPAGNGFTLSQTTPPLLGGLLGGGTQTFSLSAPVTVTLGGAARFGPGTGSNLLANINGSSAPPGPFFTLKRAKPKRSGRTLTIANLTASLTSPAAQVLGSFGGVKFKAGQKFATITIVAKT